MNKILQTAAVSAALSLIAVVTYHSLFYRKVAYVKTGVIIQKFAGVSEAQKNLEKKLDQWQHTVDTLENNYNQSLDAYNREVGRLSEKERQERKEYLDKQSHGLQKYVESIERNALTENQKLTEGTVNQINTFIRKYAEDNGYDLILGVTAEGNIMHGSASLDITDEVLEQLNKEYKGLK
jgi:outer membrane protein